MSTVANLNIVVTAATQQATAALARTQAQLNSTAASGQAASRGVGGLDSRMTMLAKGGAAAAAYGLYKAVRVGMDFEQQMSNLKAVTGASGKQMQLFERQAMSMAKGTIFGSREVAQAQTELAKGGLTAAQILGGALKPTLDLAAAGQMDLAQAANTTANALNLFALPANQAGQVADMLATAANTTTAEVSDFAMALTQGGSAAKQVGFSLNDTVVVLESLAKAGIKNSDAGTSMKAALLQLAAPTQRQAQLARQLGLEFFNQAGEMKNPIKLAGELKQALGGMTRAQRTAALKILAGTDGFRTLAALFDAGADGARRFSAANRAVGTAAATAAAKTDNLAGDLERLKGEAEAAGISLYNSLEPALRDITKGLTTAAPLMGDFLGEVSTFDISAGDLPDVTGATSLGKVIGEKVAEGIGIGAEKETEKSLQQVLTGAMAAARARAEGIKSLQDRLRSGSTTTVGVKLNTRFPEQQANALMDRLRGIMNKGIPWIKPKVDKDSPIRMSDELWRRVKSTLSKPIPKIKPTVDRSAVGEASSLHSAIAAQFSPIIQRVLVQRGPLGGFAEGGRNLREQVGVVGERGRELMRTDSGWAMLGERGAHLAAIPSGADIFNANETRKLLAMGIPGFAGGKEGKRRKREKRLARREAARASTLLNLESILAGAELTPGITDDSAALDSLIKYWRGIERANKNAARIKNPLKRRKGLERLLEARNSLKSYTDQKAGLSESLPDTASGEDATLLRELLNQANLRYAVSQAQRGVLRSTPYVGSFAGGGIVPGPMGAPGIAVVHGGESIAPPPSSGGQWAITITNWQQGTGYMRSIAGDEAQRVGRRGVRGVNRTPGKAGML